MPPRTHSLLSPSSKEWFHCGLASKFFCLKDENESNEAADFGTQTHELGEAYINESLKLTPYEPTVANTSQELKATLTMYDDEMERLASGYANYVIDTVRAEERRTNSKPIVLVEQQLEMDYAPDTHGTVDCAIISDDRLTIIDNKTGYIKVTAEENGELNSQLGIYGLYAYKLYADVYPIKDVRLVIYQQRIGNVSEKMVTAEELTKWGNEVLLPAALNALSSNPVARSGSWCKYCPGNAICRRRQEDALNAVGDAKKPELLTDSEIERLLPQLDNLIDYCNSVKDYALKKALNDGYKWQGFKVVESTTRRKITDERQAGEILTQAGFEPYRQVLKPLTEIEKMVGKDKTVELLGSLIVKPSGQPVLATIEDTRKEILN